MKNKELGYLLIGGAVVFLLTQNRRPQYVAPQFRQLPPPPPRNRAAEYQAWINLILQTYGNISALWAPGGPFYNAGVNPADAGANWNGTGNFDPGGIAGRPRRKRLLRTI